MISSSLLPEKFLAHWIKFEMGLVSPVDMEPLFEEFLPAGWDKSEIRLAIQEKADLFKYYESIGKQADLPCLENDNDARKFARIIFDCFEAGFFTSLETTSFLRRTWEKTGSRLDDLELLLSTFTAWNEYPEQQESFTNLLKTVAIQFAI